MTAARAPPAGEGEESSTSSSPTCRQPPAGANGCCGSKRPSSPPQKPVPREALVRLVGEDCRFDDLIADLTHELRGRPYDLILVAGGYALRTKTRFTAAIRAAHPGRRSGRGRRPHPDRNLRPDRDRLSAAGHKGGGFEAGGTGRCRFTLIAETDRVRHFRALPETRLFFGASKLGLEALFCTLKMGLIDRSIDRSVKRCRPAWSIRMIRRCLKWSGAPLCSGICCDNRVGRSPPKSPMPPLRNSEFHDQRCFAQLLAFVGRVGLRAFCRSSAEREMGVCYLIRGSNASSKSK